MNYKKSAKAIAQLLEDESGGIRVNALYALVTFKDKFALPKIRKCFNDVQILPLRLFVV